MKIKAELVCGDKKAKKLLVVPHFGLRREQTAPVVPTPQYQGLVKNWRKHMAAEFTITDSQIQSLGPVAGLKDKKGNAVPLPAGAACVWQVDTPTVFALKPSADTLSCDASAVGPLTGGSPAVLSLTVNDSLGNPLAAGTIKGNVVTSAPVTVDVPLGPVAEQP